MRIGISLPAAVPGAAHHSIGEWAELSEAHAFASLGTLDRLVSDNLDPIVALAAAAARTRQIELMTTILTVLTRQNAVVVAKQLGSLDLVSGGHLDHAPGVDEERRRLRDGGCDDAEALDPARVEA